MKYRFLRSSGLIVSRIALGTMTFGVGDWGCNEREAHLIMKKYIDAGGNHLDGADVYAGGKTEEIIGRFLPRVQRDNLIIASKCYFPAGTQLRCTRMVLQSFRSLMIGVRLLAARS